jgi:hypothetical protein
MTDFAFFRIANAAPSTIGSIAPQNRDLSVSRTPSTIGLLRCAAFPMVDATAPIKASACATDIVPTASFGLPCLITQRVPSFSPGCGWIEVDIGHVFFG